LEIPSAERFSTGDYISGVFKVDTLNDIDTVVVHMHGYHAGSTGYSSTGDVHDRRH
jgi:hypothetical protein